ncbi:MAG TPA: ABC transporter permease subunit [Aquabacterium sp.]|uniref:ABC transporter permease subunit n=1 Tax=Aquabacterium sp. TaxID=1872578 RepID=UPI002E2EC4BC|nr:ABC transporter permease subunit [Aquabacterium sp.]HEX5373549.1 ABC transporter permease subunit [Aquabacterium sp.]
MLDFLTQPAGFDIGETGGWLFDAQQPLWHAFAVGLGNTLRVSLPAIVLALALGTVLGLGRLSALPVQRRLSLLLVDTFRNVPLLVQLLMWYFALVEILPDPSSAVALLPGVWLSKGGLSFPWWDGAVGAWSVPVQEPFNVQGGAALTPEYLAVLMALSTYTGAFIAEIVRAGVLSVPRSLLEAAETLGATQAQMRWRVLLPQAWRAIMPPLSNQILNLIKNSSLAVAVGYPDLVSVGNTALNQTGRVFECMALMMLVYLLLSLLVSTWMNRSARLHRERAAAGG